MSMNDTIADMLTRVRNAARNKSRTVVVRYSKVCAGIAQVLKDEGYIAGFDKVEDGRQGLLRVELKYGPRGEQVLNRLVRISKAGRRVYRGVEDLPRPMAGLGIAVISTSQGIVSDRQAREKRIGGELLCTVE